MIPNSGVTPDVSTERVFVPYSIFMLFEYSLEIALRPWIWPRTETMSSSAMRMRRPLPRPSYGIDVRPGQPMTMRSPRPAVFLTSCLCRPVPKASIRLMATVPHTIPKTVRKVRSFSDRTSRISWRKTSLSVITLRDLFRRPLHHLVAFFQSGEHFDVQSIRDASLDLDLLRFRFRRRAGDLAG